MANPDPPGWSRHRGSRAIQRIIEYAPATGGLALWIRHQDIEQGPGATPIATDGTTIFYAPAFARLPLPEQIGLVAHEVLHVALRHPQRLLDLQRQLGDLDRHLFNVCADAIVNSTLSHLGWLRLAPAAVYLDQLLGLTLNLSEPVDKALLEWDVERLYRAVDDRRPPRAARLVGQSERHRAGGDGPRRDQATTPAGASEVGRHPTPREDGPRAARVRRLGGQTERDLWPSDQTDDIAREAEQMRDWSERILRAHASDGEQSLLRALIADRPRARIPWEAILRTRMRRALARRVDLSWSRPARSYVANRGRAGPGRRLPWEPGTTTSRAVPRLVIIVDVSGSIDDSLLGRFAREVEAITRRLEARLAILIGDRKVSRIEHFVPGRTRLRELLFQGGGGTDFTPLLEAADALRPDLVLVLTDLQGPANVRPRWPVIWAVPASVPDPQPLFGTLVRLD